MAISLLLLIAATLSAGCTGGPAEMIIGSPDRVITGVIAKSVFDMTEDIQQTKVVAITIDIAQDSDAGFKGIVITNHGGKDVGTLSAVAISINGMPVTTFVGSGTLSDLINVGSSVQIGDLTPGGRDHVVVVGTFIDGTSQVLLDTWS